MPTDAELRLIFGREAQTRTEKGLNAGIRAVWDAALIMAQQVATRPYQHGLGWEASVEAIKQLRENVRPEEGT